VSRRLSIRNRGVGRMTSLVVLAGVLLTLLLPQAASADSPSGFGSSLTEPSLTTTQPSRTAALGYSPKPSSTEPYAVCPAPAPGNAGCFSILDPHPIKTALGYEARSAGPLLEGSGEKEGIDPKELQEAYKIPATGGSTQTVAIVDAYDDPNAEKDLETFREKYKLDYKNSETACTKANGCFKKVNQEGKEEKYPTDKYPIIPESENYVEDWGAEMSLDLDMISAICPECKIVLVEANNRELDNLYAAEDEAVALESGGKKLVTEVSNSWGSTEFSEEASEDTYFDHTGVPITASAGDSGYGVEYPAASKDVISVGGTTLKKAEKTERGWKDTVWSGTGGGCSAYEPKPEWQRDSGCAKRTDNDVAAVANNNESPVSVYDSYEYEAGAEGKTGKLGWILEGGTSAASPLVAGIEAHTDSATKKAGAEAFYLDPGMLFHVSEGSNGSCGAEGSETYYLCHATKEGYDGPAGNGVPDGVFSIPSPTVTTGTATSLTETGATLLGTVNPNGIATKYYFEYGTTESYGSKTAEASAGSGTSSIEVSKTITSLTVGTKYHYRIVATSIGGTTYGEDQAFTTTHWSIQELASPKRSIGIGFWEPTCTSSASCMAFGAYANNSGTQVPLVEMWNGSTWSVQEPPSPTGAKAANVRGGSCISSTECIAVGEYENSSGKKLPLAEAWNGTSWSIQEPPSPTGAKASHLNKVSCISSTECLAVGELENSSGSDVAFTEKWNGTTWSLQEPPIPTGAKASTLTDLSCTSSTWCVAVGYFLNSSSVWMPFAEKWNGTTWSVQELPLPTGGKHGLLASVSCASTTACVAVSGFENSSGKNMTYAEKWNGTAWSAQELPTPTETKASGMWGVSCASSTECIGVGEFENSSGKAPLAEKWNGTTWSDQEPPVPTGGKSSLLGGVSCVSSTACVAVGSFDNSSGKGAALAETWNGTAWSMQELASPKGLMVSTKLWTVSCTSSTECIAVGRFENTVGTSMPLAEKWSGTSWSDEELPSPAGTKGAKILGASCMSSTSCMVVGQFENSSGKALPLAETWNGTSWSVQEPPIPAGAKASTLNKVSCTSSTECIAAGEFENSSGVDAVLAEKWNGTSWSVQEPPIPAGAKASTLGSLSCASSTLCIAAGYSTNSSGLWMLLIEKWNGTTWAIQETPLPTGGKSGDLVSVSCTSSTACVADGGFENSSGKRVALAEKWNGTAWSGQELPSPTAAKSSNMWGVSCVSSTECAAAGEYENSSGTRVLLAEKWNGATWSIQEPQGPPAGAKLSDLGAVACTSSTECMTVGSFENSSSKEIALAERYQ
jgi:hypothetical protein